MDFTYIKENIAQYNGKIKLISEKRCTLGGSVEAGKFRKSVLGYTIKDSQLSIEYDNGDIIWELNIPKKKLFEIEERLKKNDKLEENSTKQEIERKERQRRERKIEDKMRNIKREYNNGLH
jgi:hypothetical protein